MIEGITGLLHHPWFRMASCLAFVRLTFYDSMFTDIHSATRNLLLNLFGLEARLKVMDCQRQEGGKDCGVFAIAVCTALAHDLPLQGFNQDGFMAHLLKCFEDLCLTPFP